MPASAPPAPWAARSGRDAYGAFADLELRGEVQRFRWCPPGNFVMGDEFRGRHKVTLTRGFWMGETEVTQRLYVAVMGVNPSYFRSAFSGAIPVDQVSWRDSVGFANRLSRMSGLRPAYTVLGDEVRWDQAVPGFRLPTEAEWEYAARAGQDFRFAGSDDVGLVSWIGEDSGIRLHSVGRKNPNAWGLRDMSGNVWEWCWDGYGDYPGSSVIDPVGSPRGFSRVLRGGSWGSGPRSASVADRNHRKPGDRSLHLGLRLVRTGP